MYIITYMKLTPVFTMRITEEEKRYARALSIRRGCRLKETGSVAYALKWLLHREAKIEKVPLGEVYGKNV